MHGSPPLSPNHPQKIGSASSSDSFQVNPQPSQVSQESAPWQGYHQVNISQSHAPKVNQEQYNAPMVFQQKASLSSHAHSIEEVKSNINDFINSKAYYFYQDKSYHFQCSSLLFNPLCEQYTDTEMTECSEKFKACYSALQQEYQTLLVQIEAIEKSFSSSIYYCNEDYLMIKKIIANIIQELKNNQDVNDLLNNNPNHKNEKNVLTLNQDLLLFQNLLDSYETISLNHHTVFQNIDQMWSDSKMVFENCCYHSFWMMRCFRNNCDLAYRTLENCCSLFNLKDINKADSDALSKNQEDVDPETSLDGSRKHWISLKTRYLKYPLQSLSLERSLVIFKLDRTQKKLNQLQESSHYLCLKEQYRQCHEINVFLNSNLKAENADIAQKQQIKLAEIIPKYKQQFTWMTQTQKQLLTFWKDANEKKMDLNDSESAKIIHQKLLVNQAIYQLSVSLKQIEDCVNYSRQLLSMPCHSFPRCSQKIQSPSISHQPSLNIQATPQIHQKVTPAVQGIEVQKPSPHFIDDQGAPKIFSNQELQSQLQAHEQMLKDIENHISTLLKSEHYCNYLKANYEFQRQSLQYHFSNASKNDQRINVLKDSYKSLVIDNENLLSQLTEIKHYFNQYVNFQIIDDLIFSDTLNMLIEELKAHQQIHHAFNSRMHSPKQGIEYYLFVEMILKSLLEAYTKRREAYDAMMKNSKKISHDYSIFFELCLEDSFCRVQHIHSLCALGYTTWADASDSLDQIEEASIVDENMMQKTMQSITQAYIQYNQLPKMQHFQVLLADFWLNRMEVVLKNFQKSYDEEKLSMMYWQYLNNPNIEKQSSCQESINCFEQELHKVNEFCSAEQQIMIGHLNNQSFTDRVDVINSQLSKSFRFLWDIKHQFHMKMKK